MATINAASAQAADIQTAINSAVDGDIVSVPAGSVTWTGNVTIPGTKGVQVVGAGVGSTVIDAASTYGWTSITTNAGNSLTRISGFTFNNVIPLFMNIDYRHLADADNPTWRIDHCAFNTKSGGASANVLIQVNGYSLGLIDNCSFYNTYRTFVVSFQLGPGYDDANMYGGYSWKQTLGAGTNRAVYFEDCTFNNTTSAILGNFSQGARLVFRHNTVTGPTGLEFHSGCTNGHRNPRWTEIYDNTWTTGGSYWCGLFIRSGNGHIFNNDFSGYQQSMRFDLETVCRTDCSGGWNALDKEAYPVHDQIGAGIDTGWASTPSTTEAKLRLWNNNLNGSHTDANNGLCAGAAAVCVDGRDYWQQAVPFTGAAGIGVGALSARPASGLTTGVGYWATDTETLYRATGATTWETFYTPYTYPHPLRDEADEPGDVTASGSVMATSTVTGTATVDPPGIVPTISLSVAPMSQQVRKPTAAYFAVSSTAIGGFTGNVALSVLNAPDGAVVTFDANPIDADGSTTMTITTNGVGATDPTTGTDYNMTLKGVEVE